MDHTERDELSSWVQQSVELLAPPAGWEPDQRAARRRVDARLHRPSSVRRSLLVAAAAVGIVCVFVAAVPLTEVLAQQAGIGWHGLDHLWYWFTGGRHQPVRLGALPDEVRSLAVHALSAPGSPPNASDVAEASRRAGFVPRLPGSDVIPGTPRLTVFGPASSSVVFRAAELESALREARATSQTVPAAWDGARIGVSVGTQVIAEWSHVPDSASGANGWADLTLAQSAPPVFTLRPGIDLTSFAALAFQATGVSPETARRFAQYAVPPAALLVGEGAREEIGAHALVLMREVSLRRAPAILIEEFENFGQGPRIERLILMWNVPDRVYVLKGELNAALDSGYDLAGAWVTLIDVANTID
jgi:hypothetical protein